MQYHRFASMGHREYLDRALCHTSVLLGGHLAKHTGTNILHDCVSDPILVNDERARLMVEASLVSLSRYVRHC